jgi:hypothetical protein
LLDLKSSLAKDSICYFWGDEAGNTVVANSYIKKINSIEYLYLKTYCSKNNPSTAHTSVYIINNGKVIELGFGLDESVAEKYFESILSTFKFSESKAALEPADSQSPVAGICSEITNDSVVSVIIGEDNVPQPRCTKITANQKLKIVNNSNTSYQINLKQFKNSILPGQSFEFPNSVGSFLSPGVHFIAGDIWLQ